MPKILCIDDDPALLETLASLIELHLPNLEVLLAEDGESGVRRALQTQPDVILLDLMLPDISGYEVCRRLKNDPGTKSISIIVITGLDSDEGVKTRSLDAGADAFLKKPFESSELVAQINAMMRLTQAQNLLSRERDRLAEDLRAKSGRLDRSEQRWELLLQSTNDGIWDWDITSGVMWFSPHWEEVLGYRTGEISPTIRGLMKIVSPEDRKSLVADLREYLCHRSSNFQTELRMMQKNGTYRWFLYRGQAVWAEDDKAVRMVGTQADIHERKIFERKLVHIAHHDTLTGLPNRTLYVDRLSQSLARAQRFKNHVGVLFLDLDGFKAVNDTYGHNVGDLLLQQVSKRLLDCVRKVDTVARFGGDEFMIILADIKTTDDAGLVASRIVSDISKSYMIHGNDVRISTSVGVSLFPEHSNDEETLIKYADIAMYSAKQAGKNQYRMYETHLTGESTHLPLTSAEFATAIENGEIEMALAPVTSLREGLTPIYAASLFWSRPIGDLNHDKLISLAEESDCEHLLFDAMLHQVCHHIQRDPDACYMIGVSSRQFHRPQFAARLVSWLNEHQVEGRNLALSMGENTILQDLDYTTDLFRRLRHAGVKLVIDRFGAGYISMQHFCDLSLDYLKIAPFFMREFSPASKAAVIVSSMLDFAHRMNMQVIAAGVCSAAAENWLRDNGCDYIIPTE